MIQFTCPHCSQVTDVSPDFAGKSGPCAKCGKNVTVPKNAPIAGVKDSGGSRAAAAGISITMIVVIVVCLVGCCIVGGVAPLGVALLLPAVQASREAARRTQCSNNMKMISLGLLNYHDTMGKFPPAYTVDEQGNKLHSWRVLILPYIEQEALYEQFKLDEPWDSPHNMQVAEHMPDIYQCPSNTTGAPLTSYLAIDTPGGVFDGSNQSSAGSITDGSANTILFVEDVNTSIPWNEPRDLAFDPTGAINSQHPTGGHAAFSDGSVKFIAQTISLEVFRNLVIKNDGNVVNNY